MKPKPFVFTLMPFHKDFNDIWKLGIQAACEESGAYCERVDEQIYDERILDRIYNQINKADYIIADMTGKNPNVFYEVGYAHALNKKVILLIQEDNDIPFDLKHHPFIVYKGSITNLKSELTKRLNYFTSNPISEGIPEVYGLQFYLEGFELTEECGFEGKQLRHPSTFSNYGYRLEIDILNNSNSVYDDLRIGLLTDTKFGFKVFDTSDYIKLPNGKDLFIRSEKINNLFPSSYHKIEFFPATKELIEVGDLIPMTLRTFNKFGIRDINFTIKNTEERRDIF